METTILRDGQPLSGTGNSYSVNDYHFGGSIITPLNAGDIISVQMNDPNDAYVMLNDEIGARLIMLRVGDIAALRNSADPRTMNLDINICPC
jgi:hypothetical protein